MLDVEWSVEEVADVTLVEVTVHNPTAVDRRVRVDDRLDGPTLPPRTDGVPERGWDANGYGGVVPAGDRLRLGYAAPAPPVDPPVTVADEGRAAADGDDPETDANAAEAMRLLDDASPPADALPSVAAVDGDGEGNADDAVGTANDSEAEDSVDLTTGEAEGVVPGPRTDGDGSAEDGTSGSIDGGTAAGGPRPATDDDVTDAADGADRTGSDAAGSGSTPTPDGSPAPVDEWFADVERRVDHAERLTDASVVEAAAVLDERGGLSGVERLPERVTDDETALRAVAERATTLADRAAATDVPLAALRRLS